MDRPSSAASVERAGGRNVRVTNTASSSRRGTSRFTSFSGGSLPQYERLVAAPQGDLNAGDADHFEVVEQPALADRPVPVPPVHERARIGVPHDRGQDGHGGPGRERPVWAP